MHAEESVQIEFSAKYSKPAAAPGQAWSSMVELIDVCLCMPRDSHGDDVPSESRRCLTWRKTKY
jgi:hypothetical protein